MGKTKITSERFTDVIPSLKKTDQFSVFERKEFVHKSVPYNRRDFYKISLTSSTGMLYYADKAVLIDRPALMFFNPMVPYAWEDICESREGFFCLFSEDFFKRDDRDATLQDLPLFRVGTDPVFFVDPDQLAYVNSIFHNMLNEFKSDYAHKFDLLRNHLNLLLHEAMKMQPSVNYLKNQNASVRVTSLFIELLERQFPIDTPQYRLKLRTANHYAQQLSVHVNYLNRVVKEITGKTTTEHLMERMIVEARALLLHTDWSINDIAYSLGYEYPTYFNNFFKKQTGVTPGSLRNQQLV